MRNIKFLDIIRSLGGYLRVDNLAGYKDSYTVDDLGDRDFVTKEMLANNTPSLPLPFIYNIPAESATPIIISFNDSTIKYGTDDPESLDYDLSDYRANPDIWYELIDAVDDTITTPYNNVATNAKQWADNTHQSLVSLTITPNNQPDPLDGDKMKTLDDINIIIKP